MSRNEPSILDDLASDPTVTAWRWMLVAVGNMHEDEFGRFVAYWRDDLLYDRDGYFAHESAGRYAAPQLVPPELKASFPFRDLIPLHNAIHLVLDRFSQKKPFDYSEVPTIQAAIRGAVSEWVKSHQANPGSQA